MSFCLIGRLTQEGGLRLVFDWPMGIGSSREADECLSSEMRADVRSPLSCNHLPPLCSSVSHTCTLKHPCILTTHLNSFLETRKQDAATQVKQQVPISQHRGLAWACRLLQYGKTFLVLNFFNINYGNKLVY